MLSCVSGQGAAEVVVEVGGEVVVGEDVVEDGENQKTKWHSWQRTLCERDGEQYLVGFLTKL